MSRPKPNLNEKQLKARHALWVMKWRKKYPERHKLARKRAYLNRKLKALKIVGIPQCINCGCNEIDFLEFNHKNGGGSKEFKESKNRPMMDRILTGKRNVDDLNIVCRVCNALEFLKRKNYNSSKKFQIKWM